MGDTYGSRKFILAIGGLILGAVLLVSGNINGSEFVTLTLGLSGAYMTANAWGKNRIVRPDTHDDFSED